MGYSFLEFMKGIGIFIVCAQSVMHFAAGKSYEKYVKLLIGVMILAQFVVPIRALLTGEEMLQVEELVEEFQTEMESTLSDTDISYTEPETDYALQQEIRSRTEDIAERYGFAVQEVVLYETPPKLMITVSEDVDEQKAISVDKIEIGIKIPNEENPVYETEPVYTAEIEEMRKEICICLGTEDSYVEIDVE